MNEKQIAMLERIQEKRAKLFEGYITAVYDELPTIDDLDEFPNAWRIGMGSITGYRAKKYMNFRFLKAKECMRVGKLFLTYTNINFDYLEFHQKDTPGQLNTRLSHRQQTEFSRYRGYFPTFAIPFKGEALYFDLKAFHANIMLAFGRDLDYLPGKDGYLEIKPNHNDYPFWDNKEARNRLHATARGEGSYQIWKKGIAKHYDFKGNRWKNESLIQFTHDLSTLIGYRMIHEAGAMLANEDGYIVPIENRNTAFNILDDIGLPCAIKDAGYCELKAFSCYQFPPSVFNPEGKIANEKRFRNNTAPQTRHWNKDKDFDLDHFYHLVKGIIHESQANLLRPTYTPDALSELNRLRA